MAHSIQLAESVDQLLILPANFFVISSLYSVHSLKNLVKT